MKSDSDSSEPDSSPFESTYLRSLRLIRARPHFRHLTEGILRRSSVVLIVHQPSMTSSVPRRKGTTASIHARGRDLFRSLTQTILWKKWVGRQLFVVRF
jgi:hypothetical protein